MGKAYYFSDRGGKETVMYFQVPAAQPDSYGPMATIVAAVIGAIAGIGGTFLAWVLPERKKRPSLLADFLDTIGKDVGEMITMFKSDQIPHRAGHALDSEIAFFEKATNRKLLGAMALDTLEELRKLSQEAEIVDVYLYQGANGEALRDTWITRADRIIGQLRGEASKLRLG